MRLLLPHLERERAAYGIKEVRETKYSRCVDSVRCCNNEILRNGLMTACLSIVRKEPDSRLLLTFWDRAWIIFYINRHVSVQTGYIVVQTGFLVQTVCDVQVGYVVLLVVCWCVHWLCYCAVTVDVYTGMAVLLCSVCWYVHCLFYCAVNVDVDTGSVV